VLAIGAMERNASAFLVEGCKVGDAFERQFMFVGITARAGRETSLLTGSSRDQGQSRDGDCVSRAGCDE